MNSVVVAAKTFDDNFYTNSHYARVGGIPAEELALLEMDFLFHIHFSLYVSCEDYERYYNQIYKHAVEYCNQCSRKRVVYVTYRGNGSSSPDAEVSHE